MPHDPVPTTEPKVLTAGTSWAWDRTLSDHPPGDGWALKYTLRGPNDLDVTATVAGDTYEVRVTAADSGALGPGRYRLRGFVEKGTDRHLVYDEVLLVEASPLAAVNQGTFAERMVAKLESELEASTASTLTRWRQGGREQEHRDASDIRRDLSWWKEQVAAERRGNRFGQVKAEFRAAS